MCSIQMMADLLCVFPSVGCYWERWRERNGNKLGEVQPGQMKSHHFRPSRPHGTSPGPSFDGEGTSDEKDPRLRF